MSWYARDRTFVVSEESLAMATISVLLQRTMVSSQLPRLGSCAWVSRTICRASQNPVDRAEADIGVCRHGEHKRIGRPDGQGNDQHATKVVEQNGACGPNTVNEHTTRHLTGVSSVPHTQSSAVDQRWMQ